MRIFIAVNSLVQGGAQKFTVNLATELISNGHQVKILCLYPPESDFFSLPPEVEVQRFVNPFQDRGRKTPNNFLKKIFRFAWRVQDLWSLRQIIKKENPELLLSIESYMGVLVGLVAPSKLHHIISERVHPAYHPVQSKLKLLQKFVYKKNNVFLHAQGWEIAKYLSNKYSKPVTVLPNIVNRPSPISESLKEKTVLVLARYSEQKGIDLLLEAWALLNSDLRSDWKLKIYGDGDKDKWLKLVTMLEVGPSVELHKASQDTEKLYSEAELFVLPSRFEGFSNALAEAMAHGLPCIATDCPSAVRELTLNGSLAKLVAVDKFEIFSALKELMEKPELRRELAYKSKIVSTVFNSKKVTLAWEDFFRVVLSHTISAITCPSCGNSLTSKNLVEMSHVNTLENDLNFRWGINYNFSVKAKKIVSRLRCNICGTSTFDDGPGNDEFYEACYESPKYSRGEFWDYSRALGLLGPESNISILDIGSGISRFHNLIQNARKTLTIVELNDQIRASQELLTSHTFKLVEEVVGVYDLIMVSHFLEHVANPNKYLQKLGSHLTPKGSLFITVPNARFGESNFSSLDWPPHHVSRFTQKGMEKLANSCNLRIVSTHSKNNSQSDEFDFMFELKPF